jgi:hypothetical protein
MELKKEIKIKKSESEDVLQKRLQEDFVVKNMPSFSSLSATSYSGEESASLNKNHKSLIKITKNKTYSPKLVGLIIIGIGVLVICVLFYLAYRFLIVPSMAPPVTSEEPVNNQSNQVEIVAQTASVVEPLISNDTEIASSVVDIIPAEVVSEEILEEKDNLVLPVIVDSDNDGLSDAAEIFLGSNIQLNDTDNDSYSDFEEINSGYNPNGAGKLEENNNLALFSSITSGFALIYPHDWGIDIVSSDSTLFSAPNSSFIQVSREDSGQINTDIISWYQEQFSDTDTLSQDRFMESNFGPGIISADGQIIYFLGSDKRNVYVISYIKSDDFFPYIEIFRMMASTLMPL